MHRVQDADTADPARATAACIAAKTLAAAAATAVTTIASGRQDLSLCSHSVTQPLSLEQQQQQQQSHSRH
ncbi:MAG: hypothetical protein WDW36_005899 [Sanguina aurantia]